MKTEDYIVKLNKISPFEGVFLERIREEARADGIPVMLRETSQFLAMLIKAKAPKNFLEIGTAVGYSGSIMLKFGDSESKLTTLEIEEDSIARAKDNFKSQNYEHRVRIFSGDASEIIPVMSGKFDFIFLDGPKSKYYEYYPYLKKMLVSGGILVADNVLFRDLISGAIKPHHRVQTIVNNMREFLDNLVADEDFLTTIYNIGDGLSVSIKIKG